MLKIPYVVALLSLLGMMALSLILQLLLGMTLTTLLIRVHLVSLRVDLIPWGNLGPRGQNHGHISRWCGGNLNN